MPFPVIMDHDRGAVFLAIVFALVVALALASVLASRSLGRAGSRAKLLLFAGLAAVLAAMTFFPVTFSLDAYAYAAFGDLLGVHGLNPYVERLAGGSTLGDPVLARIVTLLGTPLPDENYGPLWTYLSAALAFASHGGGLALAIWTQRAAGAAALIIAALGACRLQAGCAHGEPAARVSRFALHPLALYESAAAGHNDMLMIAPAVWAFAVVDASPLFAGVLIGASISIKYVAALALPFLAIRALRRGGARALAAVAVPALALPVALFAPLWPGWTAAATLANLGSTLIMSPQWLVDVWLPGVGARAVAIGFAAAFGAVVIASIAAYARDGSARHLFRSIAALTWSSPLLNPWYVQWLLPAAASNGRWARYAWWFGFIVMARYVEDALRFPSTPSDLAARIAMLELVTLAMLAIPLAIALLAERRGAEGAAAR